MFVVYDENMNIKPFPQGVTPLDIFIGSINKSRNPEAIEGRHGYVDKGYVYDTRPIELIFKLESNDTQDYRLLRDEVFAYYSQGDFIYVSEKYQLGKRYKVIAVESFIPERINRRVASTGIALEMADLPFAESIGTTQDIERNGIDAESKLWGFGMGLIADDDSIIYTHNSNDFKIYNAGNERVHPFQQELKITISNVTGSTSYLELKNDTNGTTFRVNETVSSNQTIVLDGPNITSNSLQYLRKTNRQFIELEPGWNQFKITGATSAKVEFDFRLYFL